MNYVDRAGEILNDYPSKITECGHLVLCWGRGEHGDLIYPRICFDCLRTKLKKMEEENGRRN